MKKIISNYLLHKIINLVFKHPKWGSFLSNIEIWRNYQYLALGLKILGTKILKANIR